MAREDHNYYFAQISVSRLCIGCECSVISEDYLDGKMFCLEISNVYNTSK